jgi:dihydroorotase
MRYDLLIKGGELIDPASGRHGRFDVAVRRDRVADVAPEIPTHAAYEVIDAGGLLVTPGLIDLHTHVYHGATYYGVEPDGIGARTGVTTWIDAGSAGAFGFDGLRKFIIDRSRVRISAFLNISWLGLTGPDYELTNLEFCDLDLFEMVANRHRDILHGVKVRMGDSTVGSNRIEPLKLAIRAGERCELPVMVHIAEAPPELSKILGVLRVGDIVTHCFTGLSMRLFDDSGRLLDVARRAIDAGVILDIGHGAGSFTFASAEAALAAGIRPQAISTDIHQVSAAGPMFDLPTCLSKFLALGTAISDVIAMATSGPARILGFSDRGTLAPGALADIALFRMHEGHFALYDNIGAVRVGRQLLRNVVTIVGGRMLERTTPPPRAVWAEKWDRGGTNARIRTFQDQLRQRGHTPDQMCSCAAGGGLRAD